MNKKCCRVASEYIEYGCGFPIKLVNVPMVEDDGEWIPNIDYNKLDKVVLLELCRSPSKLTGNQIRFIRLYFEKTYEEFASLLRVKHSTVIHWEKQKDDSAKITWGTELILRLFVLCHLESSSKSFKNDYKSLMEQQMTEQSMIAINSPF